MVSKTVRLEYPGLGYKHGFDGWNKDGRVVARGVTEGLLWRKKPAFFRVNSTGRYYVAVSRMKTEELPAAAVQWIKAEDLPAAPVKWRKQTRG